ncbi:MAG: hypothetical protein EXR73_05260 [Myxococcales bacterium]|nr:hypothetical protein [Myxococcales bacterium]
MSEWRCKCRWTTGARVSVLALALAACGDEVCGAAVDAGAVAALVTVDGLPLRFGEFRSLLAGDCGRASISVGGRQEGSGYPLTLCVIDPASAGSAPVPLDDAARIDLVDLSAHVAGCDYQLDFDATPEGTVAFDGLCADGAGPGFNLTLAGRVAGIRRCASDAGPPVDEPVSFELTGTVAVRNVSP